MRKTLQYIFCLTILLLASGSLWAKDKYTVTILPFSLHSAENIDYVKQGIEEMLTSRISVSDRITVTNKDAVLKELKKYKIKDISIDDVYNFGKKMNSDYVIWGSITKIGNSISINGKLVDIVNNKSDIGVFTQSQNLDDVIPKINDFANNIIQNILGTTPQPSAPPPATTATVSPLPLPLHKCLRLCHVNLK